MKPRWFRSRGRHVAAVLSYHRVCDAELDPFLLAVTPERFAEHLEVISERWRPMSLREAVESLRAGKLPSRAVVLTFDDGYADNLHGAKPLLERHGIPATVFVTTGYLGGEREFWWDELVRILLGSERLPGSLRLRIADRDFDWSLGTDAQYAQSARRRHRSWSVLVEEEPTARHTLLRSLHSVLRPLPTPQREPVLERLREWAGTPARARPTERALTDEEVSRLADGGLVEVGGHTVTHPVLSSCSPREQQREVTASRDRLRELLDRPVSSFAYPFGAAGDYSATTVSIVRGGGFRCACSTTETPMTSAADPFELPRATARAWEGAEFERRLELLAERAAA